MSTAPVTKQRVGTALSVLLLLLTVFGPISMDLYLPVLPALTEELGATTSVAQLTLTACLLGLAGGQIIAGPLSDRFGRRPPLLIGVAAYVVVSVLCAVSPSIEVLILARFVQGLAGAVGIVIAQAAGRDVYTGAALIRYYARLTVLGGLAAIVGPVIGGQLARVTDWRGLFIFLAAVGVALLLGSAFIFGETLPADRRTAGGLRHTAAGFRTLLADRRFVGSTLIAGLSYAAIFAYLSGATFILQGIYGLSPQQYSYAFALVAFSVAVSGFVAGRTATRWSEHGTLVVGLAAAAAGALGLLAVGIFDLPLPVIMAALITMVSGVSIAAPPNTSMALTEYPRLAGTASSLLGLARFGVGGIAAPLVGIAGADTVVPLGIVSVAVIGSAIATQRLLVPAAAPVKDVAVRR